MSLLFKTALDQHETALHEDDNTRMLILCVVVQNLMIDHPGTSLLFVVPLYQHANAFHEGSTTESLVLQEVLQNKIVIFIVFKIAT